MRLDLLCAGAAQGLVSALQARFALETGCTLNATFGAVGAMLEKFDAGAPADAIILTRAQIDALAQAGRVLPGSGVDLGVVRTGVASKESAGLVSVATANEPRTALQSASEIHFPDPQRATAGIHFAKVVDALGLRAEIAPCLRPHPNGASAMRALAASPIEDALGCTQKTEILATPGARWIGALPQEFELATVYCAAVTTAARAPRPAAQLLALLGGEATRDLRLRLGFEAR